LLKGYQKGFSLAPEILPYFFLDKGLCSFYS